MELFNIKHFLYIILVVIGANFCSSVISKLIKTKANNHEKSLTQQNVSALTGFHNSKTIKESTKHMIFINY